MPDPTPADDAPWWAKPWFGAMPSAAQGLYQPILPGWTFGNVIVSEQNSSAPDTEREIVSTVSYGRQIGKLLDAVSVLIEAQGGASADPAYREVLELRDKVDEIKREAAKRRIEQLRRDLDLLKVSDPKAFEKAIADLRQVVS